MARIQLVETSLRDGNQSLWGAMGVTTANNLAIAQVMDRVTVVRSTQKRGVRVTSQLEEVDPDLAKLIEVLGVKA